jgi:hypothetical protein
MHRCAAERVIVRTVAEQHRFPGSDSGERDRRINPPPRRAVSPQRRPDFERLSGRPVGHDSDDRLVSRLESTAQRVVSGTESQRDVQTLGHQRSEDSDGASNRVERRREMYMICHVELSLYGGRGETLYVGHLLARGQHVPCRVSRDIPAASGELSRTSSEGAMGNLRKNWRRRCPRTLGNSAVSRMARNTQGVPFECFKCRRPRIAHMVQLGP